MIGLVAGKKERFTIMIKRIVYGTFIALVIDAGFLYALYLWDISSGMELSYHAYIALGLGIFFTVLIGVALAFLSFLSARLGVDEIAHDVEDKSNPANNGV